jgi:hypothetical protein
MPTLLVYDDTGAYNLYFPSPAPASSRALNNPPTIKKEASHPSSLPCDIFHKRNFRPLTKQPTGYKTTTPLSKATSAPVHDLPDPRPFTPPVNQQRRKLNPRSLLPHRPKDCWPGLVFLRNLAAKMKGEAPDVVSLSECADTEWRKRRKEKLQQMKLRKAKEEGR